MDMIRTDAALSRPIVFDGPGEHGGAVFDLVSSVVTDLSYTDGVERVSPDALTADLDEWVGRPVVFDDGQTHDGATLEAQPEIQAERNVGTVVSARFDPATGERTMRIAVPKARDAERIRRDYNAVSEAYRATTRPADATERAQGVDRVQVRRAPLSLALIHRNRGGRAGPRARVRTDGADTMAFSLDELRVTLDGIPDDDDAAKAMLAGKVAKMGGKPAEEPSAEIEPVMDAAKPEEMAALKADVAAQKMRADAAEARLLVIEAAEVASDLKLLNITCDGFDATKPTADSVGKARAARDAAALARIRTDAVGTEPQGNRPAPRVTKTDAAPNKPYTPIL